ncbi:MAG: DUF234 domain-containing protein [Lachnospiraceae bacterium]|nr:DUF234 domain-containing protein [Lachnospiraceae bacterium]
MHAATLSSLRRFADSGENAMVVLYGNPCISRAGLLQSFVRRERVFFYTARCVTDREQRRLLAAELSAKGVMLPENAGYPDILARIVSGIPAGERLILILDQFEHFFYEETDLLKTLVKLVRSPELKEKLFVLLVSDAEVWVENCFVACAGSAAAEISGFVKWRESGFAALRAQFPGISLADAILVYTVFGGETALWEFYDPTVSFRENLTALFLTESRTGLQGLAMQRLREQVREPAVYATILANLAAGREKLNDLYHATGIPRAKLSVYMKTLMAPGFVEKVFSYGTAGAAQTKKGVYRISNAFFRFYFTCIYPYESARNMVSPEKFYDLYLSPALSQAACHTFRKICTEYVEQLDAQGRLPFAIDGYGEWNGKAGAIDIVAESETGETLIGLCSYDRILTEEDYHFILTYARQAGLHADHCYLFSGAGFSAELTAAAHHVTGLRLIGMKELEHV